MFFLVICLSFPSLITTISLLGASYLPLCNQTVDELMTNVARALLTTGQDHEAVAPVCSYF